MKMRFSRFLRSTLRAVAPLSCALLLVACGGKQGAASEAASSADAGQTTPAAAAPAAESTGGFDGQQAYQYVADQVAIGPRGAGTEGDTRAQQYIVGKLQSFGCPVDQEDFHASTPIGSVAMKNIVAKVPGASPDIVLFTTHYDTKRLPNFVGADDGGSSTGVMLELARLVCARKNALTVWVAFFDGEEAFNPDVWQDPDNTYGSRELAARLALSGDLGHVKAMLLADLVGGRNLHVKRDSNSTGWLTDMVWSTAARLGYKDIFLNDRVAMEDDHLPFLHRNVAAVDIIDLDTSNDVPYWHTPADTLDKISPRSLAIVGHVLIATLPELEQKFHSAARP
jgi:Zn-dependent M28 family amino/carboxypeptidase